MKRVFQIKKITMTTNKNITTVDDGQGQSISVVGDTYRILISGEQTNGNYAVINMLVPQGGGPGPHAHKDVQEMFYVVEGEIDFKMEGSSYTASKGSFVNIPLGGAVHSFKNTTDKVAHLLCTVIPAGLEKFFQEIGKPVDPDKFLSPMTPTAKELNELKSLAEKYGQELYPPDFLG